MLFGVSPFFNRNQKLMFKGIIQQNPTFPKHSFSKDCEDLILKLLKKNPLNRIGSEDEEEIFNHPWFNSIDFASLKAKKVIYIPLIPSYHRW